jgi:hypothetical protein
MLDVCYWVEVLIPVLDDSALDPVVKIRVLVDAFRELGPFKLETELGHVFVQALDHVLDEPVNK